MFKVQTNEDTPRPHSPRSSDHPVSLALTSPPGDVTRCGNATADEKGKPGLGDSGSTLAQQRIKDEKDIENDDADGDDDEDRKFPEGGGCAWSVVLGSFLFLFAGLGVMNTIGTLHA